MALVFVVDDDPLVCAIVEDALRSEGYVVGILNDGKGAIEVIEAKRPALVILDCAMPGVPGIEVLRQIRASPRVFATPTLMLTARSSPSDRDIAERCGASGYLAKPFDRDRLVLKVEELILMAS